MKYHDNMTEAELKAFMRVVDELHEALLGAAEHDAKHAQPVPDEWEDEMNFLRGAALSNGKP
jgi:hypothetical protein